MAFFQINNRAFAMEVVLSLLSTPERQPDGMLFHFKIISLVILTMYKKNKYLTWLDSGSTQKCDCISYRLCSFAVPMSISKEIHMCNFKYRFWIHILKNCMFNCDYTGFALCHLPPARSWTILPVSHFIEMNSKRETKYTKGTFKLINHKKLTLPTKNNQKTNNSIQNITENQRLSNMNPTDPSNFISVKYFCK